MSTEKRRGRQEPTVWVTQPYEKTEGQRAIDFYNSTGRTAQDWQVNIVNDILAVDDDGLFIHSRYGFSVPRQNGKNEVLAMIELDRIKEGKRILHTAHRTSTSRAAWTRLCKLLDSAGIHEQSADNPKGYKSGKSKGQEWIILHPDLGGGEIQFRTRSTTGGLGETYDLLVIDEAQEYQEDQESALKYTIVSSNNPQTIYLGTPPTPYSSGILFVKYRKNVIAGKKKHAGWAEWSVDQECDPENVDAWYETNPSLGYTLTERAIEDEIGEDNVDFNIQRLGLWIAYNLQSVISIKEWKELEYKTLPKFEGYLSVGVKFNKDGLSSSLCVACKTSENKIFTEVIGCKSMREGVGWIVDFLVRTNGKYTKVVVDGANGFDILAKEMKDFKLKAPHKITTGEYIEANSKFEQHIFAKSICHMEQPAVDQIVSNCDKRTIGSGGGFGYKSIKLGVDISILDSMILAIWCAENFEKTTKKQTAYY